MGVLYDWLFAEQGTALKTLFSRTAAGRKKGPGAAGKLRSFIEHYIPRRTVLAQVLRRYGGLPLFIRCITAYGPNNDQVF